MLLAFDFPPDSAEWTFFIAAVVLLAGPIIAERFRTPGLVGVIIGGTIVGPFVLDWVAREGTVEALGALGIVSRLTLSVEPSYAVRQDVYEDLDAAVFSERFDELAAKADSVSFFTEWREGIVEQVWLKSRVREGQGDQLPDELFGAVRATVERHPIRRLPADACTATRPPRRPVRARIASQSRDDPAIERQR